MHRFLVIYAISASRNSVSTTGAASCAEGVLLTDGEEDGETSSWPVVSLVSSWSSVQGFLKKLNSELCLILTNLRFLALAASIALFTASLIYPMMLAGDAGQLLQIVLFDMLCMIIYHFELIQNEPILWLEHNSHNFSASCLFGWDRHTPWYTPWYTPLLWIRTCHGWGWQCSWANSYGWPDTGWGIAPHQQPAGLSGHSGWIHYTWSAQTDRQTEEWGREGESMGYTKHHGLFLRMSFTLQFITHEALVEW